MKKNQKIIERLENLKAKNKDFYKRHPELLKQVNLKIKALKSGDYEIVNANWIIAYIGGKIVDVQKIDIKGKKVLKDKVENHWDINCAKNSFLEFFNDDENG